MNVQLTPELEQFIYSKIESGAHPSASHVVIEALRMMKERDELLTIQKEEIRSQIADGYAALRRGEGIDGEEAFRLLDERHKRHRSGMHG